MITRQVTYDFHYLFIEYILPYLCIYIFSFNNGLKEVDIVPLMFYQEETNLKHMQLTTTIWIDPVAVMQPWPEEENRLPVATRPFQLMVIDKLVNHRNNE